MYLPHCSYRASISAALENQLCGTCAPHHRLVVPPGASGTSSVLSPFTHGGTEAIRINLVNSSPRIKPQCKAALTTRPVSLHAFTFKCIPKASFYENFNRTLITCRELRTFSGKIKKVRQKGETNRTLHRKNSEGNLSLRYECTVTYVCDVFKA